MSTDPITNNEDIIDSRDIIERIEYLESIEEEEITSEEQDELDSLNKIKEECEEYSEWKYGATFIRDSYWVDYVQEFCEDIGDIPKDLPSYISCHIDWEGVARDINMDYTAVYFDGIEYYVRF